MSDVWQELIKRDDEIARLNTIVRARTHRRKGCLCEQCVDDEYETANVVNNLRDELDSAREETARLREIIDKHDLCHDLHGKVGHAEFEEGCRRESIKEHGSCLWADRIEELTRELATANHWRARHCADSAAANAEVQKQWQRIKDLEQLWLPCDQTVQCAICLWVDWEDDSGEIPPHSDDCPLGYITNQLHRFREDAERYHTLREGDKGVYATVSTTYGPATVHGEALDRKCDDIRKENKYGER